MTTINNETISDIIISLTCFLSAGLLLYTGYRDPALMVAISGMCPVIAYIFNKYDLE